MEVFNITKGPGVGKAATLTSTLYLYKQAEAPKHIQERCNTLYESEGVKFATVMHRAKMYYYVAQGGFCRMTDLEVKEFLKYFK